MNSQETTKRFERASGDMKFGYKIRNWIDLAEGDSIGKFLAKLWTLFGPPDEITYEGYIYNLKDSKTGLTFSAYCGPSGPAFGGTESVQLNETLSDFEVLLENTALTDCEIEFPNDYGIYRTGAHSGIPFGKTIADEESVD